MPEPNLHAPALITRSQTAPSLALSRILAKTNGGDVNPFASRYAEPKPQNPFDILSSLTSDKSYTKPHDEDAMAIDPQEEGIEIRGTSDSDRETDIDDENNGDDAIDDPSLFSYSFSQESKANGVVPPVLGKFGLSSDSPDERHPIDRSSSDPHNARKLHNRSEQLRRKQSTDEANSVITPDVPYSESDEQWTLRKSIIVTSTKEVNELAALKDDSNFLVKCPTFSGKPASTAIESIAEALITWCFAAETAYTGVEKAKPSNGIKQSVLTNPSNQEAKQPTAQSHWKQAFSSLFILHDANAERYPYFYLIHDEYAVLFATLETESGSLTKRCLVSKSTYALRRVLVKEGIRYTVPYAPLRKQRSELGDLLEPEDSDYLHLNDSSIDGTPKSLLHIDGRDNINGFYNHLLSHFLTHKHTIHDPRNLPKLYSPAQFLNAKMCRAALHVSSALQHTRKKQPNFSNLGTSFTSPSSSSSNLYKVQISGAILPSNWKTLTKCLPSIVLSAGFSIYTSEVFPDTSNFDVKALPSSKPIQPIQTLVRHICYNSEKKGYFKG